MAYGKKILIHVSALSVLTSDVFSYSSSVVAAECALRASDNNKSHENVATAVDPIKLSHLHPSARR